MKGLGTVPLRVLNGGVKEELSSWNEQSLTGEPPDSPRGRPTPRPLGFWPPLPAALLPWEPQDTTPAHKELEHE
jgi:hypothetical protein